MSLLSTLAIAMGASWVSGINLYAAVATLGLLGRFAGLQLPGELTVLTNWWVIGVASALYVVEFVADKIPYVDSVWDVIHTFIRVPAGAALAAASFGDFDPAVQIVALLLGGGLALSSHGTKATARAAINTSPEPVSNITASLVEDVVAIGSTLLAAFFPVLLIILVVIFVIISIIILPKIINFLRRAFARVRRIFA
ncbi:MAG TPA: DUF4126 domain-containing protein [Blastocatellia bacterium]|nr:DUF4126 domain-containing protein [Blastocatellia bacterium]